MKVYVTHILQKIISLPQETVRKRSGIIKNWRLNGIDDDLCTFKNGELQISYTARHGSFSLLYQYSI